ncbi:hypothetical protein LZC95_03595 [Pendulispora brunnea]|uniref:Flp pilus-assembly TadG-like N-terminal domain-containing protein n=1 Tax=Pendulispora brunnea TaxID=2905690 RepID=A0ABZ2KEC7_9BACT
MSESRIGKASLKDDQRGAIMVMGLFMALSLVASLWFLIGIGQAIIFRDRGQEAADAMAFSVAAVDARGMDLIAVINIIMLALVGIYLLIQIVADAMMASIIFEPEGISVDRFNTNVVQNGVLTVALPVLGASQAVVAVATPWVGTLMIAPEVASHYQGFENSGPFPAFGLQNIPGAGFSTGKAAYKNNSRAKKNAKDRENEEPLSPEKQAERDREDKMKDVNDIAGTIRLGLPVAFEPNKTLCVRAMVFVPDLIADLLHLPSPVKWAIDLVIGTVAGIYAERACNKRPFDWPGPKKMAGGNGSAQTQVYGFANGNFSDKWERKVKLGGARSTWGGGDSGPKEYAYNAQAEFFYECNGYFWERDCNGQSIAGTGVGREHALYSIGWRARLMKYKSPAQLLFENLVNGTQTAVLGLAFDGLEAGLKGIGAPDKLAGAITKQARNAFDRSDFANKELPKAGNAIKNAGKEILDDADNYH